MKRLHIALAVKELEPAIEEYTKRLGAKPVSVADNAYALWRTDQVNLSISVRPEEAGQLRHLGFEDSEASEMSADYDAQGIMWERFTAEQQREEIFRYYPTADYPIENL
ncbi:hypothetical protein PL75_01130 [Neisseria arctica]|uniref:VOC domain-containing protein n=1 Tax=Neisseria arctica TaxID=1470200 RepID=A0A0J0YTZ5_9NEIS|nr:hypothetical protein [Neisseria arctica]KLT73584.1 hypothetical protein PL75_01130 [Neisseria arctica]UOO85704.1 hypothetical protein LVJ86_05540 [Neisseria arctica]